MCIMFFIKYLEYKPIFFNFAKVITSSLDRSVKVWNINNIFEQVHVIDRHELPVDHIR